MTKVVINDCYGGFGLSEAAIDAYVKIKGLLVTKEKTKFGYSLWKYPDGKILYTDFERDDPALVQVVEELGKQSWGKFSKLIILDIPAGSKYRIKVYDGLESIEYQEDIQWKTS